jgi:hypothetical protein
MCRWVRGGDWERREVVSTARRGFIPGYAVKFVMAFQSLSTEVVISIRALAPKTPGGRPGWRGAFLWALVTCIHANVMKRH